MNGAKVVMMGIAYKEEIEDMRESPALKVLEHLEKNLAHVSIVDPYVSQFQWDGKTVKTVNLTEELIKESDAVVITTAHKKNINYKMIVENARYIFDAKNVLSKMGIAGENVEVL